MVGVAVGDMLLTVSAEAEEEDGRWWWPLRGGDVRMYGPGVTPEAGEGEGEREEKAGRGEAGSREIPTKDGSGGAGASFPFGAACIDMFCPTTIMPMSASAPVLLPPTMVGWLLPHLD